MKKERWRDKKIFSVVCESRILDEEMTANTGQVSFGSPFMCPPPTR